MLVSIFLKRHKKRTIGSSSFEEQAVAWAISLGCIILTGVSLLVLTFTRSPEVVGHRLVSFLYTFGGVLCATIFVPLAWLMVRNQQLAAEVKQRAKAQKELSESNRKLAESLEKLKKAQHQMIRQERLRAMGQMAGGIAHDFSNALMPIVGITELILEDPTSLDDREETLDSLRLLSSAADHARHVVDRLKEFYKPGDEFYRRMLNINDVLQATVAILKPAWQAESQAEGRAVKIETELEMVPKIYASEYQLRDVFTNLIKNAMDAMPDGGTVTMRTDTCDDGVLIVVSDTGTGMDAETLEHCRDAFFSTKGDKGTGLGLVMVHETIKGHDGSLNIDSTLGKGTTLTLRLPIGEAAAQEDAAARKMETIRPLRVLMVDDHIVTQELLKQFLTLAGHRAEVVGTGAEAVHKLQEGAFDLVITDRAIPDMSGDIVAMAAKSVNSPVLVIMLTGFGHVMLAKEQYPAGVDLILPKPVGYKELRYAIADLISERI